MQRHLYERCEVVYPVVNPAALHRLRFEILESYLRDDVKAHLLFPDGIYRRVSPDPKTGQPNPPLSAQEWLMRRSQEMPLHSLPFDRSVSS